jgi:nucleoid-associated protein YgaU
LVGVSPDSFEPVDSGTGLATEQTYVTAIPATVAVPPPASAEPAERTYVIQRGDNLWQIAKRELGDGQRWKEILAANPGLNEKSLPIGRKIVLPAK